MLVPEISLTPQVTDRFISRFGDRVAILHSGLSNGEKYDEWRRVERGEAQVVVRSAVCYLCTSEEPRGYHYR